MEKLLVFGVADAEYNKIKQIANRMKLHCEQFSYACHSYTLEQLLNSAEPDVTVAPTALPSESLLIMCNLSDKRVDKLLFELRRSDVKLDYKAILTPTNRKWTVSQLLLEMYREKAAYQRMQP